MLLFLREGLLFIDVRPTFLRERLLLVDGWVLFKRERLLFMDVMHPFGAEA